MKIKHPLIALAMVLVSSDTTGMSMASAADSDDYELVFAEEFNGTDYTPPDTAVWSSSPRMPCKWARWVSRSPEVAFVRGGSLVCRAMRNTTEPEDTAQMLTGAMQTEGKFAFQYGRIEVRARTNLHNGNFPAIWLMPEPPADRHPLGGEIDILETFGTHRDAFHSVHTNWTINLNKKEQKNQFLVDHLDIDRWHVYGLEWTPQSLTFMVDGRVTGVYRKLEDDEEAVAGKQWPFDHPFYIILNQSLREYGAFFGGDPDPNYVYETYFDWVRVYQKK